ncbi:hypothetical protein SDC9_171599 [bioreactor metagenome]|uniref:Uncharacterized protein n=1 Tax=bioreactor metagenome TaxID=1076179 RepID=A0A645GC29_9ZZZZ
MLLVFLPEMLDGGKHGIGCRLAQAAQRGVLDHLSELDQLFNVAFLALALGDALQNLQHALGPQPAGYAFPAGFLLYEFHKETGYVHHAGVLVHADESARPHDGAQLDQRIVIDGGV